LLICLANYKRKHLRSIGFIVSVGWLVFCSNHVGIICAKISDRFFIQNNDRSLSRLLLKAYSDFSLIILWMIYCVYIYIWRCWCTCFLLITKSSALLVLSKENTIHLHVQPVCQMPTVFQWGLERTKKVLRWCIWGLAGQVCCSMLKMIFIQDYSEHITVLDINMYIINY
jgi:hypothetical protein